MLFVVSLILVIVGAGDKQLIQIFELAGFGCLAAAHVV